MRSWLLWCCALACLLGCPTRDAPTEPRRDGQPPQRIASVTVLSDEVLWELGPDVRGRVAAVSSLADDPRYSPVHGRWDADVPRLEGKAEPLIAARADLVILSSYNEPQTAVMLRRAGIESLKLGDMDGFAAFRDNVNAIAKAVGGEPATILEPFEARLARLRAQVRSSDRPTVVNLSESGYVSGSGTTFDDEATAAGFVNLAAHHGIRGASQVAIEQVVLWDPDMFVIDCPSRGCETVKRDFMAAAGLRDTRAVREGHVVGIPRAQLYATGSTMLDVVARLVDARASLSP